ncbi:DNA adenine methylase [Nostocaceae cyanobacterium CENA357]|uniref:site-specific DNA-methyltransferase (adenine-specific) n=1 Tax=Atlanticothrix silvestris CENA357 TaxID=1725252 RepID=A0A8J7L6J7_9CYAN|nr:DNA adenine methylase [Atlanticothrix silvestris]MBH8555797.1 DNA adenine methylase [Atlanticothrix silvestris CENA357]
MIKSPLRYPGGKSKGINQITEYLPDSFSEFREPFVGGGSVFIYLKQKFPHLKIWINDLNHELFMFWKSTQSHLPQLVEEICRVKDKYSDGKLLFKELNSVDTNNLSDFDRAVRFFILNRITFSGTVESGGFSEQAFHKRFTYSSIDRLKKLETILTADVKITNLDYRELLQTDAKDVFIFLDPPYFAATKSKLYGKSGGLHTSFEHQRFAELIIQCGHRWLITYDDSPQIRENFQCCNLFEWELQYGMNNYKQIKANKGKELFITNYKISHNSKYK